MAVLTIALAILVAKCVVLAEESSPEQCFQDNGVVPDVIPNSPTSFVKVVYPSGVEVQNGNELTPTQVKDEPSLVSWDASPNCFYTIVITDPDVPSRAAPISREFVHWLVGNVPGNDIASGETLVEFLGAAPPPATDLHRYVFLVYRQPGKLVFDEPLLGIRSLENRVLFSIYKFAQKYNLGDPIAGNFFQAQYDDYVPFVYAKLGAKLVNNIFKGLDAEHII